MAVRLVLTEDHDVLPALERMQLNRDDLVAIVRYAEAQRALCTGNDVRGFDLITNHDKLVRGLRETFCGERWEACETDNQGGIRNPGLRLRVIACNFDENAGDPRRDVRPRNRVGKGEASRAKVRCNKTGWLPGLPIPEPVSEDYTTWVLGVYAEDKEPLGAELSLPLGFSGGYYYEFVTRIPLLFGDGELGGASRRRPDHQGPVEAVDIPISRR